MLLHRLIYLNTRRIAASKRGDQFYSEWFLLAVLEFFLPNSGMEPTCLVSPEIGRQVLYHLHHLESPRYTGRLCNFGIWMFCASCCVLPNLIKV